MGNITHLKTLNNLYNLCDNSVDINGP